jgi:CheY-like chemotaxis protein
MITKEHLMTIPELKLTGKPVLSSPEQFDTYVKSLNSFIDSFPAQAEKMQDAVDDEAYSALAQQVAIICNLLTRIYAEDLAAKSRREFDKLNNASARDITGIEAFVENFILTVSSLSIDIQMASRGVRSTPAPRPVTTPRPPAPRPSAPVAPSSGAMPERKGNYPLLLAVDDAVMFLDTLKRLLEHEPYDLHCVSSGDEALKFLSKTRVDGFLLDIEMRGMNGYELANRIKMGGHSAPIIFITANSAREYVDKAVAAGAAGMLMKPIRLQQLLTKLRENVR